MQKITKSEMKQVLPPAVFDFVSTWQKENRTRYVTVSNEAGRKLYFAEDRRYTAFRHGQRVSIECGGEWNGYRKNDPINTYHEIQTGTWVVETGYFMGKPICHIMNWGEPVLAAKN